MTLSRLYALPPLARGRMWWPSSFSVDPQLVQRLPSRRIACALTVCQRLVDRARRAAVRRLFVAWACCRLRGVSQKRDSATGPTTFSRPRAHHFCVRAASRASGQAQVARPHVAR